MICKFCGTDIGTESACPNCGATRANIETAIKEEKSVKTIPNIFAIISCGLVVLSLLIDLVIFILLKGSTKLNDFAISCSVSPIIFAGLGAIFGIVGLATIKKFANKKLTIILSVVGIILAVLAIFLGIAMFYITVIVGALQNLN